MGTVPNAVFERVMQAVDANRSAEVMVVANELLNAGNSPAQLARQAVRYLRSCVIAKISGMTPESGESELLQISPEEQRRAARTAALFTEEELTRFLQTMLRTFDELGYRQEQRFHFELGLLKLVHLRRLLPVEEVLSAMGSGRTVPSNAPARLAPGPVGVPKPAVPVPAAKPAFSPFEQDKNRRKYDGIQGGGSSGANALDSSPAPTSAPAPAVVAQRVAAPVAQMPTPLPVVHTVDQQAPQIEKVRVPEPVVIKAVVAEPIEMVPAVAVPSSDSDTGDVAAIKQAVIAALEAAGQGSAADAMSDSVWTVANGEARVQTEMSKTMLPVRMNAEAEKIAKGAMRSFGAIKLLLLPGAAKAAADKKPRMAKSGSAQAKAMEHPLVQQAQKLFDAEIQTVIDLSGTD
jgi:DNA polymerase-3 subunit gamma/tau